MHLSGILRILNELKFEDLLNLKYGLPLSGQILSLYRKFFTKILKQEQ